jgi:hypothetical protein
MILNIRLSFSRGTIVAVAKRDNKGISLVSIPFIADFGSWMCDGTH